MKISNEFVKIRTGKKEKKGRAAESACGRAV